MKRSIIALTLIALFILCLPACDSAADNGRIFETLNGYAQADTQNYTIEMTVSAPDGTKTTEKYTVTTADGVRTVEYEITTLNSFTVNGNTITAPDAFSTVTKGTLDAEESAKEAYDLPKFNFSNETLRNFVHKDGIPPFTFSGEVISTGTFMGKLISGTEITMEGSYTIGALEVVTLSYKILSGNTVTVTYTYG